MKWMRYGEFRLKLTDPRHTVHLCPVRRFGSFWLVVVRAR